MARQKEFDESEALEQAMLAFWRHGYVATGVQELVDTTRVNRASLYSTFGNKHDLFMAALQRYTEHCEAGLRDTMRSGGSPREGLRAMLQQLIDDSLQSRRGCMLYNTALEVSPHDGAVADLVRAGLARIEAVVLDWVRAAQCAGEVPPEADSLVLTRMVMAAMQSITVRAGAGEGRPVLESIRDGALLTLGGRTTIAGSN